MHFQTTEICYGLIIILSRKFSNQEKVALYNFLKMGFAKFIIT